MVTGNRVASEFLRMTGDDNQSLSAPRGEAPTHFRVYDKHGRLLGPEELPLQIAATSGKPVRDFEELVEFDDGKRYHLFGNVTPLLNEAGQPAGAVAAFIDITQRALIEQALQGAAALPFFVRLDERGAVDSRDHLRPAPTRGGLPHCRGKPGV
jgi:hypothetical protein